MSDTNSAPNPSLAEVAADRAKVLRGWLAEIDEMEGSVDPEELEHVAARFGMRLKDFVGHTRDILQEYDWRVRADFETAVKPEGLIQRIESAATYLEVIAANAAYKTKYLDVPPPPPPPTIIVQGWEPKTVLGWGGAVLAALLTAAVTISLWAGDKLIEYGRLQARFDMAHGLERATAERDACRQDVEKLKAQLATQAAPPP